LKILRVREIETELVKEMHLLLKLQKYKDHQRLPPDRNALQKVIGRRKPYTASLMQLMSSRDMEFSDKTTPSKSKEQKISAKSCFCRNRHVLFAL